MASFLSRYGVNVDSERLREVARNYQQGLPSREMMVAGVVEVVEVAGAAAAFGALEQRYGEEKTTLFMQDDPDAGKDADGNPIKKSGTGLPISAAVAIGGLAAAALAPMSPNLRRHILNVSTGAAGAFAYRKGIELGQMWLDKANKTETPGANPQPPFDKSSETIAGEFGEGRFDNISNLVEDGNRIVAQRRAAGIR